MHELPVAVGAYIGSPTCASCRKQMMPPRAEDCASRGSLGLLWYIYTVVHHCLSSYKNAAQTSCPTIHRGGFKGA